MRWILPPLFGLSLALALAGPVIAEGGGAGAVAWPTDAHNTVRDMMRRGEIWSLDRILASIEQRFPDFSGAKMVAVAFDLERRRYDLSLLSPGGDLLELSIDARNGAVLRDRMAPRPEGG